MDLVDRADLWLVPPLLAKSRSKPELNGRDCDQPHVPGGPAAPADRPHYRLENGAAKPYPQDPADLADGNRR